MSRSPRDAGALSASEARGKALRLTFAPFLFQAVCALDELGVLKLMWDHREQGLRREDIAERLGISRYAATVLLEAGVAAEVFSLSDGVFVLTRVGYYLCNDRMTQVNLAFARDVCYRPLQHLVESLREGRPRGLPELNTAFEDSQTLYADFGKLPPSVQESWLEFDHFYSDAAFQQALGVVLSADVRRVLDVGGNTGRFAQLCLKSNPDVSVTIADHPVQVESAKARLGQGEAGHRVAYLPRNLLSEEPYPGGFCAVWLSQLLDCLGEEEVAALLRSLRFSLRPGGKLFVLEPCWDLQRQRAGMEALTLLSLYFTSVANGNSRMYDSQTLTQLISSGGFSVLERHDDLGVGHSLFVCEPIGSH